MVYKTVLFIVNQLLPVVESSCRQMVFWHIAVL